MLNCWDHPRTGCPVWAFIEVEVLQSFEISNQVPFLLFHWDTDIIFKIMCKECDQKVRWIIQFYNFIIVKDKLKLIPLTMNTFVLLFYQCAFNCNFLFKLFIIPYMIRATFPKYIGLFYQTIVRMNYANKDWKKEFLTEKQ